MLQTALRTCFFDAQRTVYVLCALNQDLRKVRASQLFRVWSNQELWPECCPEASSGCWQHTQFKCKGCCQQLDQHLAVLKAMGIMIFHARQPPHDLPIIQAMRNARYTHGLMACHGQQAHLGRGHRGLSKAESNHVKPQREAAWASDRHRSQPPPLLQQLLSRSPARRSSQTLASFEHNGLNKVSKRYCKARNTDGHGPER